jgi:hypothetical protein
MSVLQWLDPAVDRLHQRPHSCAMVRVAGIEPRRRKALVEKLDDGDRFDVDDAVDREAGDLAGWTASRMSRSRLLTMQEVDWLVAVFDSLERESNAYTVRRRRAPVVVQDEFGHGSYPLNATRRDP